MRLKNKRVQNLDELLKSTVGEYDEEEIEEEAENKGQEEEEETDEDEEDQETDEDEKEQKTKEETDDKEDSEETETTTPAPTGIPSVTSVAVKEVEARINQLEGSVNMIKNTNKITADRLGNIEKNIEDLLSIYELVTNQINPFIDEQMKTQTVPIATKQSETNVLKTQAKEIKAVQKQSAQITSTQTAATNTAYSGRVFLETLSSSNVDTVADVIEWMKFLIMRVGHQGLERVLDYYVVVGWISENVKRELVTYSKGIRVPEEPVYDAASTMPKLDAKDHEESLRYIGKIKGFVI